MCCMYIRCVYLFMHVFHASVHLLVVTEPYVDGFLLPLRAMLFFGCSYV